MGVDKKSLSERDICTKFITPAIMDVVGWYLMKFSEKLSLCDALESRLWEAREARRRLVESVLAGVGVGGQYGE